MKIIFASKFYYRRGGLESYLFKTKELLESHGHEVIPFSTDYYENYETEYSKYFCTYYNLSKDGFAKRKGLNNINAFKNMFFNKEAYDNMKQLIKDTKPDLVQGFGITKHLSYSIFKAAKDMGVPTIMRLSDYAILCPNSSATDGFGEICSDFSCSKNDFLKAIQRKCIHGSTAASFIGKAEVKINLQLNVYKKYVDYFIAPSRFIRNVFIEHFKISHQRIIYHPVFIDYENIPLSKRDDDFFLFAGRLSKEKGIITLLKAISKNKKMKLVIAGTGPEEEALKKYSREENINAEFVGFKHYKDLQDLISRCSALIIPSEWYENSPNIVLEAYANSKPVIGSRIGGIPELIDDGETGFLFEMGNVEDLFEKIKLIYDNKSLAAELGRNANKLMADKFTADEHYTYLIEIYNTVIKKKILLVNNYYYYRGGDCTYLFNLKHVLEGRGHNVIVFSMHHPQNLDSSWSKYFVKYINYDEEVKKITLKSAVRVATRTIFFFNAKKRIDKLIREEKPDIAHLQNIHHHITPSILYALKKNKIPVIWTLHDYQLICANISLLAHGKICERCKKHKYYWPIIVRCKKGSLAASLMSAIEIVMHHIMNIDKLVAGYIAPSNFVRNKFAEFGFDKNKIEYIPHFVNSGVIIETSDQQSDYYLFVGRITEEKGLKTLIDAAISVNVSALKIVGSGPLLDNITGYVKSNDKNQIVEFLGHKEREELFDIIKKCKFLVIPSGWYEISGLVILEAFACGKPVIGSRIGGIPELVKDNETGFTFEMGNSEDLSLKIEYMLNNPNEVVRMGKNARKFVEKELSPEQYYENLMAIYKKISQ